MGGGFPVRDRARDNNHRREITMLIFVAPQGVVWCGAVGLPELGGPTYHRAGWQSSMLRRAAPGPRLRPLSELFCSFALPVDKKRI